MGNQHSSAEESQERVLRPPKHMLWDCKTPEEHYEYIKEACDKAAEAHGEEGLRLLGFEYRMVHNPNTCACEGLTDSEHGLYDDSCAADQEYMVPIGMSLKEHEEREKGISSVIESNMHGQFALEDNDDDSSSEDDSNRFASTRSRESSASLFSLATHYSMGGSTDSLSNLAQEYASEDEEECSYRLHHVASGYTLITSQNHQSFIAHGKMYDEVARLCMEYAQDKMMEEGNLEWVTVCDARDMRALASRDRGTSTAFHPAKRRKILLVVTGKGKVQAGIFSRRHLMTTGIEASSAIPLIREAVQRGMEIVMLDPNAQGPRMSMEIVETSLGRLFFEQGNENEEEEIYVLAHSMAGSQLVRFLHNKASSTISSNDSSNNEPEAMPDALFLRKIKSVAFTDSNHNINWTKNNPPLTNFLVGPSCMYVKSHKPHEEEKTLGEPHPDCNFWKHRFGAIRTLWAGTHEHALTNYTARHFIWDHFDSCRGEEADDGDFAPDRVANGAGDEKQEADDDREDIPSF